LALVACPSGDDDDDVVDVCDGADPVEGTGIQLELVTAEVTLPTWIGAANDGSGRLFVAEQRGKIRRIRDDGSRSTYLDIEDNVISVGGLGEERGLLGVAFHPNFAENGRIYVSYVATGPEAGESRIALYTVSGDPESDEPDPASEEILLTQTQPASNHNGGGIAFGPDGYLYIGFGDGGGGGDTYMNGQRRDTFMAKILRIDVDSGDPYGIPSDNPFVGDGEHRDETWAWGLRNPWRFSFDRATGDMYIGDVGQGEVEEVDIGRSGANYGWSEVEGDVCFRAGCDQSAFEPPIYTYDRRIGSSITGGYVYRGCKMPDLQGIYFFSDYPFSFDAVLGTIEWSPGGPATDGPVFIEDLGYSVSTFGEDELGELYIADHAGGRIFKIIPE
jgi:glucose/arabinose dehydrogenase